MVLFVNNKAIFFHHLSDKWFNMKRTSFTLLALISTILTLSACHSKTTVEDTPKDAPLPSVAEQPNLEVGQCHLHTDCKPDEVCQLKSQTCQKKCTQDSECKDSDKVDGEFCRSDGRCSPKVFETIWETTKPSQTITLPWYGKHDSSYSGRLARSFKILWGDEPAGTKLEDQEKFTPRSDTEVTHTYSTPGKYHVKILGTYDGWGFNDCEMSQIAKHDQPIIEVVSFGNVGLAPCAFGYSQLNKLPDHDIPNANKLTTLRSFFNRAQKFNQPIYWDTSHVTDTSMMFNEAKSFNRPIQFDTSNVTDMFAMFQNAISFNSSIELNTSKVEDMSYMFSDAESFNQKVNFNTSNVQNMEYLFSGAKSFNQPVKFDTSNVLSMAQMFENAKSFNQPIQFNITKTIALCNLFDSAESMNSEIIFTSQTDEDNTDMHGMFAGATAFKQKAIQKMKTSENELDPESDYMNQSSSTCVDPFRRDEETLSAEEIYNNNPHPQRGVCEYCKKYRDFSNYDLLARLNYESERDKLTPDRKLVEASPICNDPEGCPCGDGYCGYLGRCIQGLCHCGDFNPEGTYMAIRGNSFKEFTCETWTEIDDENVTEPAYRWVCNREMGCDYEGLLYPYLTYAGMNTLLNREKIDPDYYESEREPFDDDLGIYCYEKKYGVHQRILSPKEEQRARELGINYYPDLVDEPVCGINLHSINNCIMKGLVITPKGVCHSSSCTCGQSSCTEGFRCVDHQTCRCSQPEGCQCGKEHVNWGTDCRQGVPYCGNLKQPVSGAKCEYRLNSDDQYYYMPQSAFWVLP